ncbi:MAG: hypothetical protein IKE74_10865 [Mogibacterium sp.]|nr:hypothetical protein [Mogibacterium sp.]
MSCPRCIQLDTIQTIMDEGNDYYAEDTDIVKTVFDLLGTTFQNSAVMQQALWWKWRDFAIASCDTPKWVRAMADRLGLIGGKWDDIITRAYAEDTDLTSLADRSYERTLQRTAIEGTEGDVREVKRTGNDTNVNSATGDNVQKTEFERMPQTASGSTQYLDSRETVTTTPSAITTDKLTHDTTDTEKYKPNTQDRETYRADDTITAVTFSEMLNNYPNVLLGFVSEFDGFFIDRWYL